MTYNLHILDSSRALENHTANIERAFELALDYVAPHVSINVDICVSHYPGHTNPKFGIGGGAFHPNLINLFLDAENTAFLKALDNELPFVLGHEIHHCLRMRSIPDDLTLADSLVTEGLASVFERELRGDDPSFIPAAVLEQWQGYLERMALLLRSEDFCFDTLFLGKHPEQFPKYTGFAVGYGLISEYLSLTGQTSVDAASIPSEYVMQALGL